MNKLYLVPFLLFVPLKGMQSPSFFELKQSAIQTAGQLEAVRLFHDGNNFCVMQNGNKHMVNNYLVDPILRTAHKKTLKKLQKVGYIRVNQTDEGQFSLNVGVRAHGGGQGLASFLYWGTKTLCYGVAAVGAATVVVATGGVAGAAVGGVVATTGVVSAGAAVATGTVAGAAAGQGVVATAHYLNAAGLVETAATAMAAIGWAL